MPFHQLQQLKCLHHGSTKAHTCSCLCSISFSTTIKWRLRYAHYGFSARLMQAQCWQGLFLRYFSCLECYMKCLKSWKQNEARDQATHPCTFTIELGRTLCCFPFIMLCNGLKISENKMHWLMDFPLINS